MPMAKPRSRLCRTLLASTKLTMPNGGGSPYLARAVTSDIVTSAVGCSRPQNRAPCTISAAVPRSTPMPTELSRQDLRRLYAETMLDHRTVAKAYKGAPVTASTLALLRRAAELLGLPPPPEFAPSCYVSHAGR